MQTNLTPSFVAKAAFTPDPMQPGKDREIHWDTNLRGFGLMVRANGHKSYVVQYRAGGASRRMTIDGVLPLEQARKQAKVALGAVARGHDPVIERRAEAAAKADTLQSICEEYLRREEKKLRTANLRRQTLARVVYPTLGARQITEIKRSDIVRLLDRIEENTSAIQADGVLAILRRIFNWHAARSDDFNSPIVRGMARTTPRQLARERTLSDGELRAVWGAALQTPKPWGQFIRYLLLTAARRDEAADMPRAELGANGEWTISANRYKTKTEVTFPLSAAAQAVLAELPAFGTGELFFTTNGKAPIQGFSKFKETFDKACGVTGWRLHDLRRTARSLMARAGVPADHAERCLGHVIPGVRGTYDRHQYIEEMRRAFEALAAQIERIVNPTDNVVALRGAS